MIGEREAAHVDRRRAPGDEIGDYRLLHRIARGGMGEVWEAEQTSLRRRVALKLVLPERVNAHTLELFAREVMPKLRDIFPDYAGDDRFWIHPMQQRRRAGVAAEGRF